MCGSGLGFRVWGLGLGARTYPHNDMVLIVGTLKRDPYL